MATKPKATSTAVAVKKPTSGNIVSIRDQLMAQAASVAGRTEGGGAKQIKYSDGKFVLPNGAQTSDPIKVVILDFVTQHTKYEKSFKAGEVSPINCAAVGDNPREMKPYASIASPESGDCSGCWANEFKSAASGDGKACKQVRSLAVLVQDSKGVIDPNGPIYIVSTTPTSNKVFDPYVKSVAAVFQMPPVGVVTTLDLDTTSSKWTSLMFTNPTPNPDIEENFARQAEARAMLTEEVTITPPAPVAAPARGKGAPARR